MARRNDRRYSHDYGEPHLSSRINALREVSLEIGTELSAQERRMREMEEDMADKQSLLAGTIRKFGKMAAQQTGLVWWVLTLFVVCVFLYIYLFRFGRK